MRVIMVTSSIVLLLTFTSYFIYELILYRQITERQLLILTEIMANNSTAALAFDSPEEADEILSALKAERMLWVHAFMMKVECCFLNIPKIY
jgi:hypothetical protein